MKKQVQSKEAALAVRPNGIDAKGELRDQFHHVIDIVPTILDAAGVEAPKVLNSVQQAAVEGYSMKYSFDDAHAATKTRRRGVLTRITGSSRTRRTTRRRRTTDGQSRPVEDGRSDGQKAARAREHVVGGGREVRGAAARRSVPPASTSFATSSRRRGRSGSARAARGGTW
jgi:arylsulfatase A-like enzyme